MDNESEQTLLADAASRAQRYLASLPDRAVAPSTKAVEALSGLGGALPEAPADPAQVLARLDELTSGAYDGVGLELQQLPEGAVRVIAPLDDSPAERAGLRSGDRIIAIDGKPLVAGDGDASAPLNTMVKFWRSAVE